MRRVTLLGLLALTLPTAVLASNIEVIPVENASFQELPHGGFNNSCGHDCHFTSHEGIPDWSIAPGSSEFTGQFEPSLGPHGAFDDFAPNDGKISAYSASGTIFQTVVPTVQEGLIYTFTVEIGHRNDLGFAGSADLLLSGGGHPPVVIMAKGTEPSPGDWSTFTATFVGTAANAGDHITIQLNSSGAGQGNFDSVKLTASPVPEPGTLGMLGTGLIGLAGVARRKLKFWT